MLTDMVNRVAGTARMVVDKGLGLGRQALRRGAKDLDDVTLARKVETEVFRGPRAPKDKVDVNVANGVVQLRGQIKNAAAKKAIEQRVRAIPEVRGIDNLLHLPKTPAPTRADSPGRARRRSTESKAKEPATGRRRITGESRTTPGEPSPDELASSGRGRQPAPMGSQDRPAG